MEIEKFGLGIRFDLDKTCVLGRNGNDAAGDFILKKLFENLTADDVENLNLYAGEFKLNPSEKDGIFTVVFTEGGHKCMQALYNKIASDAEISSYLTSYLPFVQTNVLRKAENLIYYGKFDENGILRGADIEQNFSLSAEKKKHSNKKKNNKRSALNQKFKIVLAPDKFKGSMTAETAADILDAAAKQIFPDASVVKLPIADGGEGTLNALVCACGGRKQSAEVTGPNGKKKVSAQYGMIYGDTAVIEMAEASGLALLSEEERNPLETTSRGTGELIIRALDEGAEHLIIGIGGSASNDGGIGAASALGVKFLDAEGNVVGGCGADLQKVESIDLSGLDERLLKIDITVICDVDNPLTGPNGATWVYAPQKGADKDAIIMLEKGMKNIERMYNSIAGSDVCALAGSGAAGGMGAMLRTLLNAEIVPGAEAVLKAVGFSEKIKDADLLITGEGKFDKTSVENKKAAGTVIRIAEAENIPTAVIAGCLSEEYKKISEIDGKVKLFAVSDELPPDDVLKNSAKQAFFEAAMNMFRVLAAQKTD